MWISDGNESLDQIWHFLWSWHLNVGRNKSNATYWFLWGWSENFSA
jgi:hypothetical protein